LLTELLNSAVEAVVDLASPGFHELAGRAKDLASAAVTISLVIYGASWLYLLITN
jgi:diacylglycerol kinase (ATP)